MSKCGIGQLFLEARITVEQDDMLIARSVAINLSDISRFFF